jgi:hypothetical protein
MGKSRSVEFDPSFPWNETRAVEPQFVPRGPPSRIELPVRQPSLGSGVRISSDQEGGAVGMLDPCMVPEFDDLPQLCRNEREQPVETIIPFVTNGAHGRGENGTARG